MLACVLGCDALFEWGYVVIDPDGAVAPGKPAETPALRDSVDEVIGRRCLVNDTSRAARFAHHRRMHIPSLRPTAQQNPAEAAT